MLSLLFLQACSGKYELGSGPALPFQSIYVPPVASGTALVPQAQGLLTRQLYQAILNHSHLRLGNKHQADVELVVNLVDYTEENFHFSTQKVGEQAIYRLKIEAAISLKGQEGYYFENHEISAFYDLRLNTFQALEEQRQFLPILTENLATAIIEKVLSTW